MKPAEVISMGYRGRTFLVATLVLATDTHNKTVLWCTVVGSDDQQRTPPRRAAFVYEDTRLPAHIKSKLEADLRAEQSAQEEVHKLVHALTETRNTRPPRERRDDRGSRSEKSAIAREKLEALFLR